MDVAPPLELGVFAKVFRRSSLADTLDAAKDAGCHLLHFNFVCAGLAPLPEHLEKRDSVFVRSAFRDRHLRMVGVSATFNAIHPDLARRDRETASAKRVVELAPALGTRIVTLCTGTRDPDDMWRRHPANDTAEAWTDLIRTFGTLVEAAEQAGIFLGVEPEHGNVIDSAQKARRLIEELKSSSLKIVFDPANLVSPGDDDEIQRRRLSEALELLADRVVMCHAKDVTPSGHGAAGSGSLNYDIVCELLVRYDVKAPLILHDVAESDFDRACRFVEDHVQAWRPRFGRTG